MGIQQLLSQTSEQLIAKLSVMKSANCRGRSRKKVSSYCHRRRNRSYKTLSIVQDGDKDLNLFIYVSNFIAHNGDKDLYFVFYVSIIYW